mmetsp:Transcript_28326/g.42889  ORF Transcript_28326/g.42889 Transcript_28326/m.42889 type:complete len:225 (+) Transcript_28326:1053-1727(+)
MHVCVSSRLSENHGQEREELHLLSLIIEKFSFLLLTCDVAELTTDDRVTEADEESLAEILAGATEKNESSEHHYGVKDSKIPSDRVSSILLHVLELHQHLVSRDTHILHGHPPVILAGKSELRAEVSAFNARHVLVSLQIASLHEEGSHSQVVLLAAILNDESGKDQRVVSEVSHLSRPPLGRGQSGGVENELIGVHIQNRSGLESSNVGAVPNFSLTVAAMDV